MDEIPPNLDVMSKRRASHSPPHEEVKRARIEPTKDAISEVEALRQAITSKEDWQRKIKDQRILHKWVSEARQQGAKEEEIYQAFFELRSEAIGEFNSGMEAPAGLDENDRDFYLDGDYDQFEADLTDIKCADNLVPEELRDALARDLDSIAALPDKDFHPGSEGMVQDLIHPSMYPYVKGQSLILNDRAFTYAHAKRGDTRGDSGHEGSEEKEDEEGVKEEAEGKDKGPEEELDIRDLYEREFANADNREKDPTYKYKKERKDPEDPEDDDYDSLPTDELEVTDEVSSDEESWGDIAQRRQRENEYLESLEEASNSAYRWLPAEFHVDSMGQVKITSYINNLDRKQFPELYDTIANIFGLFLPLFNSVAMIPLRDANLQVIVKAANYMLNPGDRYNGSWHVEGIPSEHIVCSGIYYYHVDKGISPKSCLAFRKLRDEGFEGSSQNLSFNANMGYVKTPEGRCLAFHNNNQHKVKHVEYPTQEDIDKRNREIEKQNENRKKWGWGQELPLEPPLEGDGKIPALRKILCFFVIDPSQRIPSTATVPEQQWDIVKERTRSVLKEVILHGMGIDLPEEVLELILAHAKWGFTKEEAIGHREMLMYNRKFYVQSNNRVWEREYSFCEH